MFSAENLKRGGEKEYADRLIEITKGICGDGKLNNKLQKIFEFIENINRLDIKESEVFNNLVYKEQEEHGARFKNYNIIQKEVNMVFVLFIF